MNGNQVSRFEHFHFTPNVEVEVDPEYPGTGDWGGPVYSFDREGSHPEAVVSSWGATLVVRVSTGSSSWVGMFAAGGLGDVRGVFACPSPSSLCVGNDGLVHLVEVLTPFEGAAATFQGVQQVVPVTGMDLLLLVSFTDVTAFGTEAPVWRSSRLVMDGLRVLEATSDGVSCSGDMPDGTINITLDPSTGNVLEGPTLGPPWI